MSTTGSSVTSHATAGPRVRVLGGIAVGIISLVAVIVFGYLLVRPSAKKGNLNITLGKDIAIKMDVENDSQSMRDLLDRVFADEKAKREAQSLLADFYDEYSPRDERILQALAKLSPGDAVPQQLRDMVLKHKRPFREELRKAQISFVANSSFSDEEVVVCDGSDFLQHKIYLYDSKEQHEAIVNARHWRACPPSTNGDPMPESIQVTFRTARKLFGDRPLNSSEIGWVGFGPLSK